ncbi:MAG TPA: efflux RND transporter periplasmic adaptor subunit, partial [Pseudoduganella sp.]
MTKKQKLTIALMCVVAALLAALMLLRQPATEQNEHEHGSEETAPGHAEHEDSHGHDDRHAEPAAAAAATDAIAMTEAQMKANGIGLEAAQPASLRETLHLPAQVRADAERTVALAAPARGMVRSVLVSPGSVVRKGDGLVTLQSPEVAQWRADAAAAAQRLQLARTVAEREQKLWDQRISARQDLDIATAARGEAQVQAD